jgi:hypothetical protein
MMRQVVAFRMGEPLDTAIEQLVGLPSLPTRRRKLTEPCSWLRMASAG